MFLRDGNNIRIDWGSVHQQNVIQLLVRELSSQLVLTKFQLRRVACTNRICQTLKSRAWHGLPIMETESVAMDGISQWESCKKKASTRETSKVCSSTNSICTSVWASSYWKSKGVPTSLRERYIDCYNCYRSVRPDAVKKITEPLVQTGILARPESADPGLRASPST